MKDLIEALNIFLKYVEEGSPNERYPFNCSHDVLWVNVDPEDVSAEDKAKLDELGFFDPENEEDCAYEGGFISFRFGSC